MKPKDVLQDLLDKTGETVNSLATKSGAGQSTIQRLLSGETKEPRRSTLEPIARYYGFPVEAFFQGKPLVLSGPGGESTGAVSVWNNEDDLPEDQNRVWVDRWEYRLSAGEGAVQWEVRQKAALPFNLSFFQAIGSKPADCKLLIVRGDSMEPFLFNRDMVMVDVSKTRVRDGGVYAVAFEDESLVKQIFKQPGGTLVLHSYNPKFPDRVIPAESMSSLRIIGEVVYRSGAGFAS